MEKKQYDLFMNMAENQDMSLNTLVAAGITVDNTSLQDRSVYKDDDWVRDKFKKSDGSFDEVSFNKFYEGAKLYYNDLAGTKYDDSIKKAFNYHRDNIFVSPNLRRNGPDYAEFKAPNPYQQSSSVIRLGEIGPRTKSIDELAQSNKVLLNPTTAGDNLENAQWGDSPNDNFFGYFTDTLVQAQYDTDGTHVDPFTGETVEHKKGDLKTDLNGNFYYEKLDGRDVYGKKVLNKMNVLTTDGSFWNKYDFFDSDDLELKSIGGTVLKNAALVGSMFIPYVGPWIAGLSVATLLAGLGATLGKMLTGSDNPTLSAIEGWSKSMDRQTAKTEYAQEHTWCWENFINLIGDVAGLLKEQRFIFEKIPSVIKGSNALTKAGQEAKLAEFLKARTVAADSKFENLKSTIPTGKWLEALANLRASAALKAEADLDSFIKGYLKIGEVLSKGYMTAITVGDTFEEAKLAGASDLDATLLTLGYAAGEYALLNTGIGEWVLPELRAGRYKAKAITDALLKDGENSAKKQLMEQSLKKLPKEAKKDYVKRMFNIGKNIARAEYADGSRTLKATIAAGAGEGVEEVSEEVLADFSKGCYDVVKWLQGDESTRLNSFGYDFLTSKWNLLDIRDRYGMSLIGGAIGGSLTNLGNNYKAVKSLDNMDSAQAILELVYMARNGKTGEFLKQVNKMDLGNKNLSAVPEEINGELVFNPGTESDNQDLVAKQAINNLVHLIESILAANGAVGDNVFLDKQTLGDLRFQALHSSATAGLYLLEYNSLNSDIVKLTSQINSNQPADTNGDGVVTDKEGRENRENETLKQLILEWKSELKEKLKQLQDLLEGKRSSEFISTALFEMTKALSGQFKVGTLPLFAEAKFGKKWSDLSDNEKAIAQKEFGQWESTEGREKYRILAKIYQQMAESSSLVILKYGKDYLNTPLEIRNVINSISHLYNIYNGTEDLSQILADTNSNKVNTATILINLLGTEQDLNDLKNILSRLETVDTNLSDEERNKAKENIAKEYAEKALNIVYNWTEQFVDPFIQRGYANVETKNLLVLLVSLLKRLADSLKNAWDFDEANFNPMTGEPLSTNPYEEQQRFLSETLTNVQNLNETPLEQALNDFSISIGRDPIKLTLLITRLNDSFNSLSADISRFTMDDALAIDLNNAIETLEMYKASILGARTDAASFNNLFGYNATLNEIGATESKLAEINSLTADIFVEDINSNLQKLNFLKSLFLINLGLKLTKQDRVSAKKDVLIYKGLRNIVTVPDDDYLRTWDGFLELSNAINGMTFHLELLDKNQFALSDEEKEKLETEKLLAENAIYEFFQKNKEKLSDIDKLKQFINPTRLSLYTQADGILNEDTESIDDNSLLWWLASRAAIKAGDFYFLYRQVIDPKSEHPLAPISTLELAVYNNYALIVNGNVYAQMYKAFRESIIEDWQSRSIEERKEILKRIGSSEEFAEDKFIPFALNFLPVPKYQNISLTEGVPGSGKTASVFSQTIELLRKFHPDILKDVAVVHGANIDSASKLKEDVGLKEAKVYNRDTWMKEINPNWYEYPINPTTKSYEVPKDHYTLTTENEIRSALGVKETQTPPSLIVIDEISKFSAYDLDLIDKFAQKYGITVLAAGDFDQTGVSGSHKINIAGESLNYVMELSRVNFIRSPKLGVSMRTDNSLKTTNLLKFLAFMLNPTGRIQLDYYLDESGLYGDKVISYTLGDTSAIVGLLLPEIKALIDTLKPGQKIGYIYDSKDSDVYLALSKPEYSPYIDFREGGSAQGLEGLYYVIDPILEDSTNPDSLRTFYKEVYTGMSRALQGSILILPSNLPFSDSHRVASKVDEPSLVDIIRQYASKRQKLLNKLAPEGSISEITPRIIVSSPSKTVANPIATTDKETLPDAISVGEKTDELKVIEGGIAAVGEGLKENFDKHREETVNLWLDRDSVRLALLLYAKGCTTPEELITKAVADSSNPDVKLWLQIALTFNSSKKKLLDILDTPLPDPDLYADDKGPITPTSIMSDEQYTELLDNSNEKEIPLQSEAEQTVNNDRIGIRMLLHSFNTFETGVQMDLDRKPIGLWMDQRIDSVNGLVRIDKLLNHSIRTVDEYTKILGRLRSIVFNTEDKSEISKAFSKELGISNLYVTFAYKSSVRLNATKQLEFLSTTPNPFEKGNSETTLYNGSQDYRSQEHHIKDIVVIVGTDKNGNLLELPLLAFSSPLTLMLVRDSEGKPVFEEVFNLFESNTLDGASIHDNIVDIIKKFDGNLKYLDLINLFKLYNFTDNGIFYIRDSTWTPAKNLSLLGSLVVKDRGFYLMVDGLEMNDDTNPEISWYTLTELSNNPQMSITSKVMKSIDGMVDGYNGLIVRPGHPFVIISFDLRLDTDKKKIEQYIKLLTDPNAKKSTILVYVLPPKVSVREYLENAHKIFTKETSKPIGNLFTSYRLLSVLMHDEEFKQLLQRKVPTVVPHVESAIKALGAIELDPSIQSILNLREKLHEIFQRQKALLKAFTSWEGTNYGNRTLAGLFDGVLLNVAYTRNTLNTLVGGENIFNPDEEAIAIIEYGLHDINGVYYQVNIPHDANSNGYFYEISDYKYDGKDWKIHGKIDSYTFLGNMGDLVDYCLSRLRLGNNGHSYSVDSQSYWNWNTNTLGNSNLDRTPQLTPELKRIQNIVKSILRKVGKDYSKVFENKNYVQAIEEIVYDINNSIPNKFAIVINGDIRITDSSNLDGRLSILTMNGEQVFDITTLLDNSGKATFLILTESGKVFLTEYDSLNNSAVMFNQNELPNTEVPRLNISSDNFQEYTGEAKELLEEIFEYDPDLGDLFRSSTYELFILALQGLNYLGEDRISDYNSLLPLSDMLKQIIQDLILIEEFHNPDKQVKACPVNIKLKF